MNLLHTVLFLIDLNCSLLITQIPFQCLLFCVLIIFSTDSLCIYLSHSDYPPAYAIHQLCSLLLVITLIVPPSSQSCLCFQFYCFTHQMTSRCLCVFSSIQKFFPRSNAAFCFIRISIHIFIVSFLAIRFFLVEISFYFSNISF